MRDFIGEHPTAADFGFPSPTADDFSISTPSLDQSSLVAALSSPQWTTDTIGAGSCAFLAPEPDVVEPEDVITPGQDLLLPPLSFDAVVGADVNPAPSDALSLPSASKTAPPLRLPSFASLGIAAPHSRLIPKEHSTHDRGHLSRSLPEQSLGSDIVAPPCDPFSSDDLSERLDSLGLVDSPAASSIVPTLPLHHYVTTLTPPDENGRITWESITKFATGPMDSPSTDLSGDLSCASETTPGPPAGASAAAAANVSATATPFSATVVGEDGVANDCTSDNSPADPPAWLKPVIEAMLENVKIDDRNTPIKILSHALPTPAIDGHLFPTIIRSLQDQTPTSPMCWINVFHALPGKFNLADLPRSPPSTPGPAIGADDYFTSKIFDSAVRVLDYQDSMHTLPHSPSPIVPPSSVDVSIVERYIPPSSANEFAEMFNMKGPSILIDRLVELSPDNGTLIFIYPTKKGGRTFTNEYLGPVLEPLLRSIVVVNGFSADMGSSAGTMAAVAALPDHDVMRLRIQNLCGTLSQTSPRMEKFHRKQATFSLVYASKEEVKLDRKVWADMWWCKQEKPRLRETINRYFRKANRALEDKTPPMIIQELLDGVADNPYRNGEPTSGIEISAFVIKRTG